MDKSVVLAALNTKCLQTAQIPEYSCRSLSGIKQDIAVGKIYKWPQLGSLTTVQKMHDITFLHDIALALCTHLSGLF